jgi:hypothetical protein
MNNILSMLASGAGSAPAPDAYSPALERRARANGFRSAAEMMAWAKQRNQQQGGTIPKGGNSAGGPSIMGTQPAAMHPSNIFSYILQKWKGATGD